MLAVLNDILDISKLQSGKYTIDAREVALDEVLEVSLASFRSTALEAEVELACQIAPELPMVKGDPANLRQVFGNIIGNAIRFTPPQGSVRLAARATSEGGVCVSVRDTGLGMGSEEIAVALTPFAQVDSGHARWREGAGLGLPIAKALVQLHGGRLEIRSERSRGTEVIVNLPPRSEVSDVRGWASQSATASTGARGGPAT